jgi:hypothetical protein
VLLLQPIDAPLDDPVVPHLLVRHVQRAEDDLAHLHVAFGWVFVGLRPSPDALVRVPGYRVRELAMGDLACAHRAVAVVLEVLGKGHGVLALLRHAERLAVVIDARRRRLQTRQQAGPRRIACGSAAIGALEEHAALRQAVDVGSTQAADPVVEIVGNDEENVRLSSTAALDGKKLLDSESGRHSQRGRAQPSRFQEAPPVDHSLFPLSHPRRSSIRINLFPLVHPHGSSIRIVIVTLWQ